LDDDDDIDAIALHHNVMMMVMMVMMMMSIALHSKFLSKHWISRGMIFCLYLPKL